MATARKFRFPLAVLIREGKAILDAAAKYAAPLAQRLPAARLTELQTLHGTVATSSVAKKEKVGEVGELTEAQNQRIADLRKLMNNARSFAKRAFAGQEVKLREQFQIGSHEHNDLASVEQRARIILASCEEGNNAAALAAKGWLASDTADLAGFISGTESADETQETGKSESKGDTEAVNVAANQLYDGLLDVQTIVDRQFPATTPANIQVCNEFKLGSFPPRNHGGKEKKDQPPAPPPA
jgi:hypothetical protein